MGGKDGRGARFPEVRGRPFFEGGASNHVWVGDVVRMAMLVKSQRSMESMLRHRIQGGKLRLAWGLGGLGQADMTRLTRRGRNSEKERDVCRGKM